MFNYNPFVVIDIFTEINYKICNEMITKRKPLTSWFINFWDH